MAFDLIVQGGTVVTSESSKVTDIGIRGGRIVAVGDLSGSDSAEVLDATGLHVLPGVIDTQVHFREPGMEQKEDLESGSRAAVAGGVTTFFEMPNTKPSTTTQVLLEDKLARAEKKSWCDFGFFVGASEENIDRLDKLEMLPGVPGIKTFVGSSTGNLLVESEELLREVMKHGKRPMPVHSEDEPRLRERKSLISERPHPREHPFLRDPEAARISTEKVIRLCRETGRPVHVLHISTMEELPLLREAKKEGLRVTCEVTPNHLTFELEDYEKLGSKVQMNPPVRSEGHRLAIWLAVQDGLFNVIGSDHAPHTEEEKAQPYPDSPSGMPGVQTLLPVMLNWVNQGEIGLNHLVQLTSEAPAKLYGIKGKGKIAAGFDADLAIVDLHGQFSVTKEWLQSKCGWSPLEGRTLKGKPVHTLVRGEFAVRDGELVGAPGNGQMTQFTWKDAGEDS